MDQSLSDLKKKLNLAAPVTERSICDTTGHHPVIRPDEDDLEKIIQFYKDELKKIGQFDEVNDLKEIIDELDSKRQDDLENQKNEVDKKSSALNGKVSIPGSFFKGMNTTIINDDNCGNKFIHNLNL